MRIPDTRVSDLRDIARTLLEEAEGLSHEVAMAEALDIPPDAEVEFPVDFPAEVRQFEVLLLKLALSRAKGNQAQAARLLGLAKNTLHYKLKTYQLA